MICVNYQYIVENLSLHSSLKGGDESALNRFIQTQYMGPTGVKCIAQLKKWRLACPKNDLDLVFPNEAGNHINNKKILRRNFRPALKPAGCPPIRFHDLRHTYASLLIAQGEKIKYIQNQFGHASPTITLNVYAHLMKPTNQEAACRLENAVFGATGHKLVTKSKKGPRSKTVTP